jgi:hypothetical protein
MLPAVVITLIILLITTLGWHLLFGIFAGAVAITAAVWGVVVASVVALCVATLLLFILTSTGMLIVGLLAFVWTVLAIVFFPVVLPVLAPLFIIFLFVSYVRGKQKRKAAQNKQC